MVENVEKLRPKLKIEALVQSSFLESREIQFREARSCERITRDVAIGSGSGLDEGGRIEVSRGSSGIEGVAEVRVPRGADGVAGVSVAGGVIAERGEKGSLTAQ